MSTALTAGAAQARSASAADALPSGIAWPEFQRLAADRGTSCYAGSAMRIAVELRQALRLLNHGPTTLITSAHAGSSNVMAAAWVMPLDFTPPRLVAVIDARTHTRTLVERSGELVVQLPTVAQVRLTCEVGSRSGRELDKWSELGIETEPASVVSAPLVKGCAAWLECRVVPEPDMQARHDLFVIEIVAAWADDALWQRGEWQFPVPEAATIHHVARGVFFATGPRVADSTGS